MTDLKTFVPEPTVIQTVKGEKIEVGALDFGKEIKLCSLLGEVLKSFSAENLNLSELNGKDILALLPSVLVSVPDSLKKACVIVLDKDEQWVDSNLNLEIAVEVINPFFVQLGKIAKKSLAIPSIQGQVNKVPKEKLN